MRQLWEVLEEMDFTAIENSFERSRNSTADAREMTALVIFGAMNQIYSSRKLEQAGISKTDHDATFMRMKVDHMRNG